MNINKGQLDDIEYALMFYSRLINYVRSASTAAVMKDQGARARMAVAHIKHIRGYENE